MMLWFVLTAMIAIAAVLVSSPFIRRHERRRMTGDADIAVYRDQLKEVDSEAALGLIDAAQADASRTEIKRRILAAAADEDGASSVGLSSGERSFAAIAVAVIVVGGSIGLYAITGNFDMPATSRASDAEPAPAGVSEAAPLSAPKKMAQTSLPPVEELVQKLVARLQRNPKDMEGWRMLGWSYYSTDHFTEAAAAYARAIELNPDSVDFRNGHVDALIRAAGGEMTSEAKAANDETLKLNHNDPRARYFKGLAMEQAGDKKAAQESWKDLLAEMPPNDPWAKELRQKLGLPELESAAKPATPENVEAPPVVADKAPAPADLRAAETMSPSDRTAMIQGMVESLAARLDKSPNDPDGWIKLMRSWSVLEEKEKSKLTLDKALKNFGEGSAERQKLLRSSQELGIDR